MSVTGVYVAEPNRGKIATEKTLLLNKWQVFLIHFSFQWSETLGREKEEGCQTQKPLPSTLKSSGGEIKKQIRPSVPHAMMEEKLWV